jgi:hypothetical protein
MARHSGAAGLLSQDLFSNQLTGRESAQIGGIVANGRRQLSRERPSPQLGDALIQAGAAYRAAADDRNETWRPDVPQPFTPPTVIPSTKNRWNRTNMMMTGSTISVAAAIRRLYATSCSLVKNARPTASGYLSVSWR